MSLRFFHIVFITLSTLLAVGCSALEYSNYKAQPSMGHLIFSILSALVGVGLVIYGVWFLKKTKNLIL